MPGFPRCLALAVVAASTSLATAQRPPTPGITVPGGYKVVARAQLAPEVFRYTLVSTSGTPQRITVVRSPRVGLTSKYGRSSVAAG